MECPLCRERWCDHKYTGNLLTCNKQPLFYAVKDIKGNFIITDMTTYSKKPEEDYISQYNINKKSKKDYIDIFN